MNGVQYAKLQLEQAFGLVGACAAGMDDAQFNWKPGGTANSCAKTLVHTYTSADFFINGMLQGKPLLWSSFAGANGLPANPMEIWGFEGNVPYAKMLEYAQQVQKSVLEYADTLTDAELDREVETNFFGKKPVAFVVQLAGMHAVGHGGDIAAIKGIQGIKGLPF
ncbi:MAG: DinB family protein [Chloroflexi bacterium]|nr:DinB family protein [Chloroflexota bacterium]